MLARATTSAMLFTAPISAAMPKTAAPPQAKPDAASPGSGKATANAAPATAPIVAPPQISVKPDPDWPFADMVPGPAGDVKTWGALAALPGTTWTIGGDEILNIAWVDPGKVMRIRRAGLYGRRETVIRAGADGTLSYGHADYGANTLNEGSAKPSGSRVALLSTTAAQIECRNRKGVLECEERLWQGGKAQGVKGAAGLFMAPQASSQGGKWQSAGAIVLTLSDQASARTLIAAMPREFPDWPVGTFDPLLGVLEAMNGREWYRTPPGFKDVYTGRSEDRAVVAVGATDNGGNLLIVSGHPDKTLVLTASKGGAFAGTSQDSRSKDPDRRSPIDFQVSPGGSVRLCSSSYDLRTCENWRLSRDRRTAWVRTTDSNGGVADRWLYNPDPISVQNSELRALGKLIGRYYVDERGNYLSVHYDGADLVKFQYPDFKGNKRCYITLKKCTVYLQGEMGGTEERPTKYLAIGDDAFDLDGLRYRLVGEKIQVSSINDGQSVIQTYVPVGFVDYQLRQQTATDFAAVQLSREVRAWDQQRNREFMANLNQRIQGMDVSQITRNNPAFAPSPMIMAAPGQPGMGGMIHIKPGYDAAAQARTDELERFAIRERLYAESRGGAPLRNDGPGSQADLQRKLDRIAADSDRKQADMDREFAAERASDERQRAADTASEKHEKEQRDARQAASDQAVKARDAADRAAGRALEDRIRANGSGGTAPTRAGIIVNDSAADARADAARQAETDRLRRLNDQQVAAREKAEAEARASERAAMERAKNMPAPPPCGGKGQQACRATQQ